MALLNDSYPGEQGDKSPPQSVWIVMQRSRDAQRIHSVWTTQAAATAIADAEYRHATLQYDASPSRPLVVVEQWNVNTRKKVPDGMESARSRD